MKKVEAIIRPYKLDQVREALSRLDILGMTIIEVKGLGRQQGHTEIYRGAESNVDFIPKIKIELLISDHLLDPCLDVLMDSARTGKIGDGKVIVTNVEQIMRIRTSEQNEDAL